MEIEELLDVIVQITINTFNCDALLMKKQSLGPFQHAIAVLDTYRSVLNAVLLDSSLDPMNYSLKSCSTSLSMSSIVMSILPNSIERTGPYRTVSFNRSQQMSIKYVLDQRSILSNNSASRTVSVCSSTSSSTSTSSESFDPPLKNGEYFLPLKYLLNIYHLNVLKLISFSPMCQIKNDI
jgi:hypothetical protein